MKGAADSQKAQELQNTISPHLVELLNSSSTTQSSVQTKAPKWKTFAFYECDGEKLLAKYQATVNLNDERFAGKTLEEIEDSIQDSEMYKCLIDQRSSELESNKMKRIIDEIAEAARE